MAVDFGAGAGLFGHGSEHQPRLIDSSEAAERRGRDLMYDTVATILCDPDERLKFVNAARDRAKVTVQLRRTYTGAAIQKLIPLMDRYFHHYHKTFKDEVRRQTEMIIRLEDTAQGLRELHQMNFHSQQQSWGGW